MKPSGPGLLSVGSFKITESFFFVRSAWLAGYKFPGQRLNPVHSSESAKS